MGERPDWRCEETDSALRHLRDALVLTQAAIEELSAASPTLHGNDQPEFQRAVRACVDLSHAIDHLEEQSSEG